MRTSRKYGVIGSLTILLFLILCSLRGQEKKLYRSSPLDDTGTLLHDYLQSQGVDMRQDSFKYIILVPPSSCPRCESLIDFLAQGIKEQKDKVDREVILVVDYPNKSAAQEYLRRNIFQVDKVLYDTHGVVFSMFDNNTPRLRVPFLYKLNTASEEIILSIPFLGMVLTEEFIYTIVSDTKPVRTVPKKNNDSATESADTSSVEFDDMQTLSIDDRYQAIPSFPASILFSKNGDYTLWADYLLEDIYLYNRGGVLKDVIRPSESEYEVFSKSQVPDDVYSYLRPNILKVIYLKCLSLSDTDVSLIASLPKISLQSEGLDTTIDYHNEICIVAKKFDGKNIEVKVLPFSSELESKGFFSSHAEGVLLDNRNFIMPIYKGWPLKGTEDFDSTCLKEGYNIFLDSFYSYTPGFVVVDLEKGNLNIGGSIGTIAMKYKTGYFLYSPKFCSDENYIYYSNGCDGFVYCLKKNSLKIQDSFRFSHSISDAGFDYSGFIPSEKPLDYLNQVKSIIDFNVLDMQIRSKVLYVLYQKDGVLWYSSIDRKTKMIKEKDLGLYHDDYFYKLGYQNDSAILYFVKSNYKPIIYKRYIL